MRPTTIVVLFSFLSACVQMPDYPAGSIRAHVRSNLGVPNATAATEDGIEGWLYKRVQPYGGPCKYFTVWFEGEDAFLTEPIQSTESIGFCRKRTKVDLTRYTPEAPRSPLNLLEKIHIDVY